MKHRFSDSIVVEQSGSGLVKAAFGRRCGHTGFNPAADINADCLVEVRDLRLRGQERRLPGEVNAASRA